MKKRILFTFIFILIVYWWPMPCQAVSVTTQIKGDLTTLDNTSELRGWVNVWLNEHIALTARGYLQDPDVTAVEGFASLIFNRWIFSTGAEYLFQQARTYAELSVSFQATPVSFLTATGYFNAEPDQAIYELEGAFELPIYKALSAYLTSKTRYFSEFELWHERATIGLLFPILRRDAFILKLNPYGGYAFSDPEPVEAEDWHVGIQAIVWTF